MDMAYSPYYALSFDY